MTYNLPTTGLIRALVCIMSLFLFSGLQAQTYRDLNGNGEMDSYENPKAGTAERVNDLLLRLSLEEKAAIVVGMGMALPGTDAANNDKVPGQAGKTSPIPRLGIPSVALADGPAGLRIQPERPESDQTFYCTAFPIATLLASSWDIGLAMEVGAAMGREAREYGVDVLLAPAMNIHRNPRAGRNFEYYSEDPVLSGKIAAAVVNGVESNGVGTSIKHFAANNQETNRMMINALISRRALREIYLRGFEIAVRESQPWTVMSAYNRVNGTYAAQSQDLLTSVLRDDWGFEGLVMTDWFAGNDAIAMMKAGNDLIMPGTPQYRDQIVAAVNDGTLDEATLDRNVTRVLDMVLKTPSFAEYPYSNSPDLEAHAQLARRAAAEGTILLKNANNTLPITDNSIEVAVFGAGSYEFIAGGSGSGDVNEAYTVSLVQGLDNAGISVDEELRKQYEEYISIEKTKLPKKKWFLDLVPPVPEMPVSSEIASEYARKKDIAFITIGRNSGEVQDRELEGDYYLTEEESRMIKTVSDAFHAEGKKVIVLLNIGNVIEVISWRDQVDAIVLAWQGGQEAGNALTDVLTGKVNPSGKLPTTFTYRYDDVSGSTDFPGTEVPGAEEVKMGFFSRGTPSEVIYSEDIFVGYRAYVTDGGNMAYPFGYGLSYTDFNYSDLKLNPTADGSGVEASITVDNSGEVDGKEVVQLYIAAPGKDMPKPAYELKHFGKTRLLKPGQSETLKFNIEWRDLASFDESRSAWVVEKGAYRIKAGASSTDIRSENEINIPSEIVLEKVSNVLEPVSIMPD